MNNSVFRKNVENVKNSNIKLVTSKRKINYLVLEPNNHTTKLFSELERKNNEKNCSSKSQNIAI